ncbi:MAG: hypothetical protein IKG71_08025 [Firmicutes bacterium]|nr:hypothetical protein [Bacillota bacterium]
MKIEILYPEIANLFGDLANIKYIKSSIPDCKVIGTDLSTKPRFLTEKDVDLVYMGTMTENSQIVAMEHLEPYNDEIKTAIETGQRFLMTGNAFEIFCKDITDLDDLPVDRFPERVDVENKVTRCLGIFDINVKRAVMHRLNSLYMGKFGDLDVVGFKSVFTYAEPRAIIPPMFETVKGPGLDKTSMGEGIRYKNFMATYLTGPLLVLNPKLMIRLLIDCGETHIEPPHYAAAMAAYEQRLEEFRRDKLNYIF